MGKITPSVISKNVTYRIVIEQIFFDTNDELIVRTGWPEDQMFDTDVDIIWATGQPPEWANNLTDKEILDMVNKKEEETKGPQ